MKNICNVLAEVADESPDAIALIDRQGQLSFAELDTTTAVGAADLRSAGLKPGDTILFFHPVSIHLYTALLSVFRAGMTAMFVDPSAGKKFIEACCQLHQPQAFFGSPKAHLLRFSSNQLRKIPIKLHTGSRWLPGSRRWAPNPTETNNEITSPTAPALITFTSGSTGKPKAVARTHEFLIAQHTALENALQLKPGEVDLITLPVFTLANLGSGLTSVLADTDLAKPGEADPKRVARQIKNTGVERVAASPAFFEALLEDPESLTQLKTIATGGAPVFPPLLDRLAKAAPDAKISAVYGSTEAEPIAEIDHRDITSKDIEDMRHGSGLLVGKPVPEIQLMIIEDQWGSPIHHEPDQPAAGGVGEIVVSGDHVLDGYLNGIGDEETKFKIGNKIWHRTGDAGRLDEQGRLWLLGRCAAKLQQCNIYPFTVECALSFIPEIQRSAAVEHEGQRVLVVQCSPSAIDQTQQAVSWANFDRIIPCKKIPTDRRHQAKIDYPKLKEFLLKH